MSRPFKRRHSIWNEMWINMGMPDADDILHHKSYPNTLSLEVMQALQMSEAENMHLREELEFTQKRMIVYEEKVAQMQESLTNYFNDRCASGNDCQQFVTEKDTANRTRPTTQHCSTQTDQVPFTLKCKQHCKYFTHCEECILKAESDPEADMITLSDVDIQTDPVEKKLKTRHSQTFFQKNQVKSTSVQTREIFLEDKETETSGEPYGLPNRTTNKCTQTTVVHSRIKTTQTSLFNRKHKSIQTMVSEDDLPDEIKTEITRLRKEALTSQQRLAKLRHESVSLAKQKDATIEQQNGQLRKLRDKEERAKKQMKMIEDNLKNIKQEKNETQKACRKHLLQHESKLKARDQEFMESRLIFAEYRRNHTLPNGYMDETRRISWDEIESFLTFMRMQPTCNGYFPLQIIFEMLIRLRFNVDVKLRQLGNYCKESYKDDPVLAHPGFSGVGSNVEPESVQRSVTRFDKAMDKRRSKSKVKDSTDGNLLPRKSSSDHVVVLLRKEITSIQTSADTAVLKKLLPNQNFPTDDGKIKENLGQFDSRYGATCDDATPPPHCCKILKRANEITRQFRNSQATDTDISTVFNSTVCDSVAKECHRQMSAVNAKTASEPSSDGQNKVIVMKLANNDLSAVRPKAGANNIPSGAYEANTAKMSSCVSSGQMASRSATGAVNSNHKLNAGQSQDGSKGETSGRNNNWTEASAVKKTINVGRVVETSACEARDGNSTPVKQSTTTSGKSGRNTKNQETVRDGSGACHIPVIESVPVVNPPENRPQPSGSNNEQSSPVDREEGENNGVSFNLFNLNQWTFLGSVFNQQ